MNKLFQGFVEIVFWIAIFSSPVLIGSAIAFILYLNAPNLQWLSIGIVGLGILAGILFAERVRRKYGCARYMSRLISTPDLGPTDTFDKKDKANASQKK